MNNRQKSDELLNLMSNIDLAIDELEGFEEYREKLEELKYEIMDEQKEYERQADIEDEEEARQELREREREYRSIQGF